ncbi:MAG: hypothetical protein Q4B85_05560 [Lachnospiraceae bacterium]|nr:hypothetical protein [Lachnospiraceae bacterium]
MKKIKMVFLDGFYRTEKEARKMYPKGYDTTFTKIVEVETLGDKIKRNAGRIILLSFLYMVLIVDLALLWIWR